MLQIKGHIVNSIGRVPNVIIRVINLNTTIDKIALSEFDTHYYQLGDNEKMWCHDEMINNDKYLKLNI